MFFLFILAPFFVLAQADNHGEKYYQWFDDLVDIENTALYNGIGYVEKYKVINKYHKFFESTDFLLGDMVYDGQYYPNLEMKYDLDEDLVVLHLKNGLRKVLLQPIKKKVEKFTIDGHRFVNIADGTAKTYDISGFYEVLFEKSDLMLLERHQKKRFKREGKNSVYYEFKSRNQYYLFYNNEYFTIRKRKDFIRIFPKLQKQIQTYSKKRSPRTEIRGYLISLAKRIELLLSETQ
ncbi:hypothetical protein [Allomuricauda sp. SCSIO 65647]|uniref:hypothetical protein n=1 Tax=Allomuricauda sp. SCSIO 65647 TaxID=2908843 RepID=UPI001F43581E|nr:hypothetical protein [Muricauda sp. SCSIO 65647]UJH66641.1 hypothetical protein L0P89_11785 [Muricauda sp. SCSIO 65647]